MDKINRRQSLQYLGGLSAAFLGLKLPKYATGGFISSNDKIIPGDFVRVPNWTSLTHDNNPKYMVESDLLSGWKSRETIFQELTEYKNEDYYVVKKHNFWFSAIVDVNKHSINKKLKSLFLSKLDWEKSDSSLYILINTPIEKFNILLVNHKIMAHSSSRRM